MTLVDWLAAAACAAMIVQHRSGEEVWARLAIGLLLAVIAAAIAG